MSPRWTLKKRFGQLSLWNRLAAVGSVASIIALALWFWPTPSGEDNIAAELRQLRSEIGELRLLVVSLRPASPIPLTIAVNEETKQGIPDIEASFYTDGAVRIGGGGRCPVFNRFVARLRGDALGSIPALDDVTARSVRLVVFCAPGYVPEMRFVDRSGATDQSTPWPATVSLLKVN